MDKRKCLFEGCGKLFQPKKESAKFCSDNCRVKHHYKNKDKKEKKKDSDILLQMQVISNTVLGALEEFKKTPIYAQPSPAAFNGGKLSPVTHDEPAQWAEPKRKIVRSQSYFEQIILSGGCEDPQDHKTFIEQVNESDLPPLAKQRLITASHVKQS